MQIPEMLLIFKAKFRGITGASFKSLPKAGLSAHFAAGCEKPQRGILNAIYLLFGEGHGFLLIQLTQYGTRATAIVHQQITVVSENTQSLGSVKTQKNMKKITLLDVGVMDHRFSGI